MNCLKSYKDEAKKQAYIKRCYKYTKKYYSKSTIYSDKRRYTQYEDELILAQDRPDTELSTQIYRSLHSIECRRCKLKKMLRSNGG